MLCAMNVVDVDICGAHWTDFRVVLYFGLLNTKIGNDQNEYFNNFTVF